MTLQPVHTTSVSRQAMLAEEVLTKAEHIGCVEQRLVFRSDKVKFRGTDLAR